MTADIIFPLAVVPLVVCHFEGDGQVVITVVDPKPGVGLAQQDCAVFRVSLFNFGRILAGGSDRCRVLLDLGESCCLLRFRLVVFARAGRS